MKLLLVLAGLAFTTVLSAKDPTKVCLPDTFQGQVVSVLTDDYGYVAADFKQQVIAVQWTKAELRVVLNLTSFEGAAINTTDGTCHKTTAADSIKNVVTQCLPANAKQLGNSTVTLGVGTNVVTLEAWEIDVGIGVTRVLLTTGANVVPVFREYTSATGKEVSLYTNTQLTVSTPDIFKIPSGCAAAVVVG